MSTPPTTRRGRRTSSSCLAAFVALTLLALPGLPAAAAAPAESGSTRLTTRGMSHNQQVVVDQINRARTVRDRRAIRTNGLMNQRAQAWAEHLRSCQCLEHRAPPYRAPRGWCAAAENVGRTGNGGTLRAVHDAFMASGGHRHNILNPRWTDLGVGVARDQAGEYFVVHAFADMAC